MIQTNLLATTPGRQTLRPYQIEAKRRIALEVSVGRKRIVLVLPTGAGKTTVAASLIEDALAAGQRVLFLAHRRELIGQCSERLDQHGIDHGVIMAGTDRRAPRKPVQVASAQTLVRKEDMPPADLILVDECHLSLSPTFRKILDQYPEAVVVGLTATPWRLDGKGLANLYQALVECVSVQELIDQGFLIQPRILSTPAPDLSAVKVLRGDYDARALAHAMDQADLVGDVVGHWLQHAAGRRTVVFATSVSHSHHLVAQFRTRGVLAEHIDADTPAKDRSAVLGRLKRGEIDIISNVEILTAGWDLPALETCVLARPTQSMSLYLQMVGRIMRPTAGKAGALILDHAGCAHDHGTPEEARSWSLYGPKDNALPKGKSLTTCPECFAVHVSGTRACNFCGYLLIKSVDGQVADQLPETAAGELVEFTQAQRMAAKRERFFALCSEANLRGYSMGWVGHRYKAEYGIWPASHWKAQLRGKRA